MKRYQTKFESARDFDSFQTKVREMGYEGWMLVHANYDRIEWNILFQREVNDA